MPSTTVPRRPMRLAPRVWRAFCVLAACLPCTALAQQPAPAGGPAPDLTLPPVHWAEIAARNEEHILNYDRNTPLRYRVHRRDEKGEVTREIMESNEGPLARQIEHNGQPLTAEENEAERKRLEDILSSPDSFLRRVHREDGSRTYASELLRNMPKAMIWAYVPGQPQLPGAPGPAVVVDFKPDPQFKPPTLITEGLTGIAGRIWIDAATGCLTRISGRVLHPVDFGWGGVLARIKEGGSVDLEQRRVSDHRWLYSHLVERLAIREVLIHTAEENAEMVITDAQPMPAPLSYREVIQRLLAMPVPTR